MEICAFVEPQQGASYDDLLAFATAAERLGFDGFFRSDHYLGMGSSSTEHPGATDAWTSLAGLARDTSRLRLGTLVSSATYREPGVLAIQVANVDDMSGGRAELGLGTGWFREEHEAYGIPFPDKRFGMLEEQLQIVTGLWSVPEGGTFDFGGEHYTLRGAPARQRPTQERIPLIVGGGGPRRTPRLAARYATEYNRFSGPEDVAENFARVRAACEDVQRDPATLKLSAAVQLLCAENDADLGRRASAIGTDAAAHRANPNTATGAPAEVVEFVAQYADLGAERIYLQFFDLHDLDHLELVGTEVLPALR